MSVSDNSMEYQQDADSDENVEPPSQAIPLAGAASSGNGASDEPDTATQILTKPRLHQLIQQIDPTVKMYDHVEELLLEIADNFVEKTVNAACLLAKHRKDSKVEVGDVKLHLEREWNMRIPGFETDALRCNRRPIMTEAHKKRLVLIRKCIKKP